MNLLIEEHGGGVRSAIVGVVVVVITISAFALLNQFTPIFNNASYHNSRTVIDNLEMNRPVIEADDVIYAEYNKEFDVLEHVQVYDYDGSDLRESVVVKGAVDTSKKGLYYVTIFIRNARNYCAEKLLYILVE